MRFKWWKRKGGLHDLCVVVLHIFFSRALVKARVVLGFFGYFQFGFLWVGGWLAEKDLTKLMLGILEGWA